MKQEFNSAMTSINSKKIPAVYHKINWKRLHDNSHIIRVLDFGSGRYINHIKQFVNQNWGIYYPYDPYWMSEIQNEVSLSCDPNLILLQYLNIRRQRQEYVTVVDIPCNTVYHALKLEMADRAVSFLDYMQQTYQSTYLFVGIIDAEYCHCGIVTGKQIGRAHV